MVPNEFHMFSSSSSLTAAAAAAAYFVCAFPFALFFLHVFCTRSLLRHLIKKPAKLWTFLSRPPANLFVFATKVVYQKIACQMRDVSVFFFLFFGYGRSSSLFLGACLAGGEMPQCKILNLSPMICRTFRSVPAPAPAITFLLSSAGWVFFSLPQMHRWVVACMYGWVMWQCVLWSGSKTLATSRRVENQMNCKENFALKCVLLFPIRLIECLDFIYIETDICVCVCHIKSQCSL